MDSLYIMISVPSEAHEEALWIEKNLKKKKKTVKIQSSANGDIAGDEINSEKKVMRRMSENGQLGNTRNSPRMGERSQSAIHIPLSKNGLSMEKRLEKCLKELKILNAIWVLGRAGKYYQVSFCTPAGEQCEHIIQLLNEYKIGVEHNSTVSILPCTLYYEGQEHALSPNKATSNSAQPTSQQHLPDVRELTAWEQFVNSVRARLMVAQVVAGVKSNAVFTFDFLILLIIAALTAAVGLVENSVVILVASMLISPLMGPVMASTFGFATRDWKLQKIGIMNELFGLLLCVLIGFLYGLFICCLSWVSPDFNWPTPEMLYRGEMRSLYMGALIAVLSGAAVAIAVLGNYSGSLTGVAISASLMPPAVNAGLLWAVAVIVVLLGDDNPEMLTALPSKDPVRDLVVLGALSLALTFINIVCIFLVGVLVLKIKEVTPRGSKDYSRLLWKETIQIARDYKRNMSQAAERMEQIVGGNPYTSIFSQSPYKMGMNQYTWTAYGGAMQDLNRPTVHDLASAWHQLTLHPHQTSSIYHQARHCSGSSTSQSRLAGLWNTMNPPPTYGTIDEKNSCCSSQTSQSSTKPDSRRFTVTPTEISDEVQFSLLN